MTKTKGMIAGCVCEKCGATVIFRYDTKNPIKAKAKALGWTVSLNQQIGDEWREVCKCPDCRKPWTKRT